MTARTFPIDKPDPAIIARATQIIEAELDTAQHHGRLGRVTLDELNDAVKTKVGSVAAGELSTAWLDAWRRLKGART
jgi:hypothetical protein